MCTQSMLSTMQRQLSVITSLGFVEIHLGLACVLSLVVIGRLPLITQQS